MDKTCHTAIEQQNCSEIVFSHPDFTVGTGITPVQPLIKEGHGLYHRSGITPYPKDISFLLESQYSTEKIICQLKYFCNFQKNTSNYKISQVNYLEIEIMTEQRSFICNAEKYFSSIGIHSEKNLFAISGVFLLVIRFFCNSDVISKNRE